MSGTILTLSFSHWRWHRDVAIAIPMVCIVALYIHDVDSRVYEVRDFS